MFWTLLFVTAVACRSDRSAATVGNQFVPSVQPGLQETPGRALVDAKSLRLQDLVSRADRIFRGRVIRIESKTVTLTEGSESAEARVRDVVIAVEDGVKNARTGEQIVIRQLVSVSTPLSEDDEVFWFLAKPSQLGLTQPLGVFSGDFRIQETKDGKVANNLRGNAGLWDGSLWTDDGFSRQQVLTAARTSGMTAARVARIDKEGANEPDNRNIPLDLLIAATKSRIKP
jgi:hypothetical protein